jgi:hypothetical protein
MPRSWGCRDASAFDGSRWDRMRTMRLRVKADPEVCSARPESATMRLRVCSPHDDSRAFAVATRSSVRSWASVEIA